jgi:hypothetical protein
MRSADFRLWALFGHGRCSLRCTWEGLNNNLSVVEPYAVAYDAKSKRLGVATQDNRVSLQSAPLKLQCHHVATAPTSSSTTGRCPD